MTGIHRTTGLATRLIATAGLVCAFLAADAAAATRENPRSPALQRAHEPPAPRPLDPVRARSQARLTHHRNVERLAGTQPPKPQHEKRRDVAVVEDQGTIVLPPLPHSPTDLAGPLTIDFRPLPDGGYRVTSRETHVQPVSDGELDITAPDDHQELPLEFAFPFGGASHDRVHVNGAGNVTLGAPDTDPFDPNAFRDAARFLAGPPRLAPLYADLFPTVNSRSAPDAMTIDWRLFDDFARLVLRADGSFSFAYSSGALSEGLGDSVVGISPGGGTGIRQDVDFASALPTDLAPGAILQEISATLNLFDLGAGNLVFSPADDGYRVSAAPVEFDAAIGSDLQLGNRRTREVALPFAFPFAGGTHSSAFVSDDGTIGFGGRCFGGAGLGLVTGPPCIAAFANNLRPDLGGAVHADAREDRLVVTWAGVPAPHSIPDPGPVTVQAVLYRDGRIVLSYPEAIAPTRTVTVGVAEGQFEGPVSELDLSADLPAQRSVGAVLEVFGARFAHFGLLDRRLDFEPSGDGFAVQRRGGGFDDDHHGLADLIPVGCDGPRDPRCDSVAVDLPFAFPFLGGAYDRLYVNSSGNVTLGEPDPDDVDPARLLGGPPRLVPFGFSGEPFVNFQLGAVSAHAAPAGVVVTWNFVEWSTDRDFGTMTFQATLRPDGSFTFVHSSLAPRGLVGIAEGGDRGPINEVDLTDDLPATFEAGAVFEEFRIGRPFALVDVFELTRAYYAARPDRHDFLVVFTDFPVDLLDASAFHLGIRNTTEGLGLPVFDASPFFGSSGELESLLMMNNVNVYWPDAHRMIDPPLETVPIRHRLMGIGDGGPATRTGEWSIGLNSPMSLLAQEVGHRWLAYSPYYDPVTGDPGFDAWGRESAHWSFFADTRVPAGQFAAEPRSSSMEGNVIDELGAGSCPEDLTAFRTRPDELVDGFSALDQYFMGLRAPQEVPPLMLVRDPVGGLRNEETPAPSVFAIGGIEFCGRRRDLTVQDFILSPFTGPRIPARGDEDDGDGQDTKTMAFVLLTTTNGAEQRADAVKRVDTFRKTWERYANGVATGGRGRFDTRLEPPRG